MSYKKTLVQHAGMPKPLAAEIRPSDNGIQIVISMSEDHVDELSLGLIHIDFPHHELHEGNHFFYTDSIALDNGVTQDYLLTVPNTNKHVHLIMHHDGSAVTQFLFYEGTDKNGTTLQTTFNNNRNSSKTPGMTIHKGTNGGTIDGVLIHQYKSGDATGQSSSNPSERRDDSEMILKAGTKYIMRVISSTNGNLTNTGFYWYEVVGGEG